MTPEEAVALYGDTSILYELYLGETLVKKVDSTVVYVDEDVPF